MTVAHGPARTLHPGAWWLWALGLATAATRTTNPLLLALIVVVAGYVVSARRTSAPWSRAFRASLVLGAVIIVARLVFEVVFGTVGGPTVLFELPTVPLPDWAAGVVIGGSVSLEGLLIGLAQAMQIATIVACVGAANSLANPSRLLKSVPGALYELGVAVVVGMTLAPQAVEDVRRIRQARRLRGRDDTGVKGMLSVARPVLEGALDRSLQLAASMDARGYGRRAPVSRAVHLATAACTLGGLVGVVCGAYGLLDSGTPGLAGLPLLVVGTVVALAGMVAAGRAATRTRYRPDPWRLPEWLTVASGAVPAAVLVVGAARLWPDLAGPTVPLAWPTLHVGAALAICFALLPAVVTAPQEEPVELAVPARTLAGVPA